MDRVVSGIVFHEVSIGIRFLLQRVGVDYIMLGLGIGGGGDRL